MNDAWKYEHLKFWVKFETSTERARTAEFFYSTLATSPNQPFATWLSDETTAAGFERFTV